MTPVGLSFLNPGLLALGGALVAVPILIHLFSRRRVRRQPWAAMEWLLAAVKRHQRRLRIENWLVLLLRALAILLLGLALSRPVVEASTLGGLFTGKRSVYLVVDNSYSMEAAREGRNVFDVAKAEADAVLSGLGSEDTVAVVATNDPRTERSDGRVPFVLTPRSVGTEGVARAKEAVAGLKIRHAPARLDETLELLRRQVAEEDVNRLVVLVTDLQRPDWDDDALRALEAIAALPANVRIVEVGGERRPNLVVASVEVPTERDAFAGRPLRLAATLENHGPAAVEGARVKVYLDGKLTPVRTRKLETLPAFGATPGQPGRDVVVVDLPSSELGAAGPHVLTVEIAPPPEAPDVDGLALDSRRDLAVVLRDRIRVAAWTRSSEGASPSAEAYLRGIYDRFETDADGRRIERDTLYELTDSALTESRLLQALRDRGDALDLVVLANVVPGREGAAALAGFVEAGGGLLVFVGDRVRDPAALNDRFGGDAPGRLLPLPYGPAEGRATGSEEPFALDLEREEDHPLALPFTREDASEWIALAPPVIRGRLPFSVGAPDGGGSATEGEPVRGVLHYAGDGSPFAVEGRYGDGKTLWVTTSLDQGWLDRALPFFLPVFLDEAAVYLTRPEDDRRNLEVGRSLVATWLPRDAQSVRFLAPDGSQRTPNRLEGRGTRSRPTWVQDGVGIVGTWTLRYEAEGAPGRTVVREEPFAVNPDPSEGSLVRAEAARILAAVGEGRDVEILPSWAEASTVAEAASAGEIAPLLLWIALGLLLLEPLLAWLFGRQRAAASEGSLA